MHAGTIIIYADDPKGRRGHGIVYILPNRVYQKTLWYHRLPSFALYYVADSSSVYIKQYRYKCFCITFLAHLSYYWYVFFFQFSNRSNKTGIPCVLHVFFSCTPLKVFYSVICLYSVLVVYLRLILRIENKCFTDKSMNVFNFLGYVHNKISGF